MPIVRINGLNKRGGGGIVCQKIFARLNKNEALSIITEQAIKEANQTM